MNDEKKCNECGDWFWIDELLYDLCQNCQQNLEAKMDEKRMKIKRKARKKGE